MSDTSVRIKLSADGSQAQQTIQSIQKQIDNLSGAGNTSKSNRKHVFKSSDENSSNRSGAGNAMSQFEREMLKELKRSRQEIEKLVNRDWNGSSASSEGSAPIPSSAPKSPTTPSNTSPGNNLPTQGLAAGVLKGLSATFVAQQAYSFASQSVTSAMQAQQQAWKTYGRTGWYGSNLDVAVNNANESAAKYGMSGSEYMGVSGAIVSRAGLGTGKNTHNTDVNDVLYSSKAFGIDSNRLGNFSGRMLASKTVNPGEVKAITDAFGTVIEKTGRRGREEEQLEALEGIHDTLQQHSIGVDKESYSSMMGMYQRLLTSNPALTGQQGMKAVNDLSNMANDDEALFYSGWGTEYTGVRGKKILRAKWKKDPVGMALKMANNMRSAGANEEDISTTIAEMIDPSGENDELALKVGDMIAAGNINSETIKKEYFAGKGNALGENYKQESMERWEESPLSDYEKMKVLQTSAQQKVGGDLAGVLSPAWGAYNTLPSYAQAALTFGGGLGGGLGIMKLFGAISGAGEAGGFGAGLGKGLGALGGLAKGFGGKLIPGGALLLNSAEAAYDVSQGNSLGVAKNIGGGIGGVAGGLIGSIIGPAGTIAGGLIGNLTGEWLGEKVGGLLGVDTANTLESNVSETSANTKAIRENTKALTNDGKSSGNSGATNSIQQFTNGRMMNVGLTTLFGQPIYNSNNPWSVNAQVTNYDRAYQSRHKTPSKSSASGDWNTDNGGIQQLHPQEMVLDKQTAEAARANYDDYNSFAQAVQTGDNIGVSTSLSNMRRRKFLGDNAPKTKISVTTTSESPKKDVRATWNNLSEKEREAFIQTGDVVPNEKETTSTPIPKTETAIVGADQKPLSWDEHIKKIKAEREADRKARGVVLMSDGTEIPKDQLEDYLKSHPGARTHDEYEKAMKEARAERKAKRKAYDKAQRKTNREAIWGAFKSVGKSAVENYVNKRINGAIKKTGVSGISYTIGGGFGGAIKKPGINNPILRWGLGKLGVNTGQINRAVNAANNIKRIVKSPTAGIGGGFGGGLNIGGGSAPKAPSMPSVSPLSSAPVSKGKGLDYVNAPSGLGTPATTALTTDAQAAPTDAGTPKTSANPTTPNQVAPANVPSPSASVGQALSPAGGEDLSVSVNINVSGSIDGMTDANQQIIVNAVKQQLQLDSLGNSLQGMLSNSFTRVPLS